MEKILSKYPNSGIRVYQDEERHKGVFVALLSFFEPVEKKRMVLQVGSNVGKTEPEAISLLITHLYLPETIKAIKKAYGE